jgi:Alpha/beta hydrolase family
MAARVLLVHSPLVGCASWELVAADLAGWGYEVGVPDLTSTVAAGSPYCSRQAEVIARSASGRPAILVGHSGAGPLLAAAGAQIRGVRGYIFVDAGLPFPGQSWMETVPPDLAAQVRDMADAQGWLPPWPQWWGDEAMAELIPDPSARQQFAAGCPRLPLAMFEEVHPPAPDWPDAPGAYGLLSEAYQDQAAKARELGWPVAEQMTHHLALLTDPGRIAGTLRELIGIVTQES